MNPWRNENTMLCEFACCRVKDPNDPEDMGSEFPDWECDWHWTPGHPARSRIAILAIAGWLKTKAPDEATSSRDFGRGYMHAVTMLLDKAGPVVDVRELPRVVG